MHRRPTPLNPQPHDVLKARAPKALERTFDCEDGVPFPRPAECPENVFDFEDGVLLIISKDQHPPPLGLHVHVSASTSHVSDFRKWVMAVVEAYQRRGGAAKIEPPQFVRGPHGLLILPGVSPMKLVLDEMIRRAAWLLDRKVEEFDGPHLTEGKMIPHWFLKL